MEIILMTLALTALSTIALLVWKVRRDGFTHQRDHYAQRLDEVSRSSEIVKRACFRSLDSVNQRLDGLQMNMQAAERQLHTIVEAPQVERREQYEAAALLLVGGNSPERVATLLGLPINQVELVRELQKYAVNGPQPMAPVAAKPTPTKRRRRRRATRVEPVRQRPILLTDVVRGDGQPRKQSA